jgi:NADH-quinone oxidoreductase subunit E
MVVGKLGFMASAFIAAVICIVVGLILGMPWGAGASSNRMGDTASVAHKPVMTPAAAPASVAPSAPTAPAGFASAAPTATSAPEAAAASASEPAAVAEGVTTEPVRLTAARGGKADNLKEIEGIGPALEKLCNELGFYHFDQIASWSDADVAWVDQNMKTFKGRIVRDKWVAQAKLIVAEGLEAFRVRAKTNDY